MILRKKLSGYELKLKNIELCVREKKLKNLFLLLKLEIVIICYIYNVNSMLLALFSW